MNTGALLVVLGFAMVVLWIVTFDDTPKLPSPEVALLRRRQDEYALPTFAKRCKEVWEWVACTRKDEGLPTEGDDMVKAFVDRMGRPDLLVGVCSEDEMRQFWFMRNNPGVDAFPKAYHEYMKVVPRREYMRQLFFPWTKAW